MNIILSGIIKRIGKTETKGSAGTFSSRSFLLAEEKDKYPSVWNLETHQAFCSELDKYSSGDKVECHVDITGREWKDTAFNTLKCYRINLLAQAEKPVEAAPEISEPVEDLPF